MYPDRVLEVSAVFSPRLERNPGLLSTHSALSQESNGPLNEWLDPLRRPLVNRSYPIRSRCLKDYEFAKTDSFAESVH
jgi:hypothetical protein